MSFEESCIPVSLASQRRYEAFHLRPDAHPISGLLYPFHAARDFNCVVALGQLSIVTPMVSHTRGLLCALADLGKAGNVK